MSKRFTTLLGMVKADAKDAEPSIDYMFNETGIDTTFSLITRNPDGSVIASCHLLQNRLH